MTHGGPKGETLTLVSTRPELKREEVRQKLVEFGVAEIAIPKKIIYIEEMPLLGTGKTDFVTLSKMYDEKNPA